MNEASSARAALALYKKGYKKVAIIENGLNQMKKCGFYYRDPKDGVCYTDILGKRHCMKNLTNKSFEGIK